MVAVRKTEAGFTLTEAMVVVVILSLLAALSTPLFTRDNNARKGRGWAQIVAQTLQRARFQAMGDRSPVHLLFYRTHIDMYREQPPNPPTTTTTTFTQLTSIPGPVADGGKTVAIWNVQNNGTVPSLQDSNLTGVSSPPTLNAPRPNEMIFTTLGGVSGSSDQFIFIRNELLPPNHPDAYFRVTVRWLTGYVSTSEMVH
jgi:prepilin-type N-terminal cleavage/methylation domain-containing protein